MVTNDKTREQALIDAGQLLGEAAATLLMLGIAALEEVVSKGSTDTAKWMNVPYAPKTPLNTKQAAKYLNVSVSTVRRLKRAGEIVPFYHKGSGWPMYQRQMLDNYLERRSEE